MKDFSKLSTREIEKQIETYTERHQTLRGMLKDIKGQAAKEALELQQTNYKLMVNRLRRELSKRKEGKANNRQK